MVALTHSIIKVMVLEKKVTPQTDKIVKSEAEWRSQLTAEEYAVARQAEPNDLLRVCIGMKHALVLICASVVTASYLMLKLSLMQAAVGLVFMRHSHGSFGYT